MDKLLKHLNTTTIMMSYSGYTNTLEYKELLYIKFLYNKLEISIDVKAKTALVSQQIHTSVDIFSKADVVNIIEYVLKIKDLRERENKETITDKFKRALGL